MFWMRNKENNFPIHTLFWRPGTPQNRIYLNTQTYTVKFRTHFLFPFSNKMLVLRSGFHKVLVRIAKISNDSLSLGLVRHRLEKFVDTKKRNLYLFLGSSVVEYLTQDRGAVGSSLTALCP